MKLTPYLAVLALIGQALIITAFLVLGAGLPTSIICLDTAVISIVYWLLLWSFAMKPVDIDEKTQRKVGGLGIKWTVTSLYAIFAIGFMIVCGLMALCGDETVPFKWQIIVQACFLFLLLLGLLASFNAADYTAEVHAREATRRRGKSDIRQCLSELQSTADLTPGVPEDIRVRIRNLHDTTRYLAPVNTSEARDLDSMICDMAAQLRPALLAYDLNSSMIERLMAALDVRIGERRSLNG